MTALEILSTVVALVAVWRIGKLDVRGQYLMLLAQLGWGLFALLGKHWGLLAQSVVLLALTLKAVKHWRAEAFARVGPKPGPVARYLEYAAKCQHEREQYPVPLPDMFTSSKTLADEAAGMQPVPARAVKWRTGRKG